MPVRGSGSLTLHPVLLLAATLAASGCESPLPDIQPPRTPPSLFVRRKPIPPTDRSHVAGQVVDERGGPLAGVVVWFGGLPSYTTDAEGRFSIEISERIGFLNEHSVRFSAPGLSPLTVDLTPGTFVKTLLLPDAAGTWSPPACDRPSWSLRKSGDFLTGFDAAFRIPRGLEMTTGGNDHGSREELCRGRDCMVHATGTWEAWSGIEQFPGFAAEYRELRERDIQGGLETEGAEYRGVHHDGTRGRTVLTVRGDRIRYENASKQSAEFFDTIIDSMCWV